MVLILLAEGRWANAHIALKQALTLAPSDPALILWSQALSSVDEKVSVDRELVLRALADAMLVEAHPQDLEDLVFVAQRLGMQSPWVVVCHAKALDLLKRPVEARELLRLALNAVDASPLHCLALAQSYSDASGLTDAVSLLREGVSRFPDDLALRMALCTSLLRAGDVSGANAVVFSASVASSQEPELLVQRGVVRMRQREFAEAVVLFREALTSWLESDGPSLVRIRPSTGFDADRIECLMWTSLVQLHDEGVQAFPTSGTLLGLIREGGLLPFDKDFDFGLPWDQMSAAMQCLARHGWEEYDGSFGLSNPRAFRHVATGLVLDLCGFLPGGGGDQFLGGFWVGQFPTSEDRVTVFPVLRLQEVVRKEGVVWMPVNADAWLQALYGNWRQPDPDFDTVIAAHNLRDFSPLTHSYALLRIITRWQQGQTAKLRSLLKHTLKYLPRDDLLLRLQQHAEHSLQRDSHG